MRSVLKFISKQRILNWVCLSAVNNILLHTAPDSSKEIIAVFQNGKRSTLLVLKASTEIEQARRLARRIALNMELKHIED